MVRFILDTNIYGRISEDKMDGARLIERLTRDSQFVVCNFRLIRNELRRAPRLLPLYDKLASSNVVQEDGQIKKLAKEYFVEYKARSGVQGQRKIMNDFKIVACATLKNCDVVASDDKRTMQNPRALEAYKTVNLRKHLRVPAFYSYSDIKKTYL